MFCKHVLVYKLTQSQLDTVCPGQTVTAHVMLGTWISQLRLEDPTFKD